MACGVEFAHQPHRQRSSYEGAAAEAHDGHSCCHARPVGEPFDQRRYRRDVANTKTAAADHAVADVDDPQIVDIDAERRDEEAAGPAARRREHGAPRSTFLDPAAENGRRHAEEENPQREDPAQLGELPIARRRLRNADQFGHRQIEHAERIGLADAQVHAQRCWRHHPPAEAGPSNRVAPIEKAHRAVLPWLVDLIFLVGRRTAAPQFPKGVPTPSDAECGWRFVESIRDVLSRDRTFR